MADKRWRQAILLSCFINLLLVVGLSGVFNSFNPQIEELIDVELVATVNSPSPAVAQAALPVAAPGAASLPVSQAQPLPEPSVSSELPLPYESSEAKPAAVAQSGSALPAGPSSDAAGTVTDSNQTGSRSILPPRILRRIEPSYPEQARKEGVEGVVKVKIEVTADGKANAVWVSGSSGNALLDEAAVQAVQRWRFVPAKDEGTGSAVSCITTLSVAFRLNS